MAVKRHGYPGGGPAWSANGTNTVRPANPIPAKRGDEIGVFNLGSTVVLVAAEPTLIDSGLLRGEHLKMGAPLWKLPEPEKKAAAKAKTPRKPGSSRATKRSSS